MSVFLKNILENCIKPLVHSVPLKRGSILHRDVVCCNKRQIYSGKKNSNTSHSSVFTSYTNYFTL